MTILYRRCWKLTFYDENKNEIISFEENTSTINPIRISFFVRQVMYIINYTANFILYNLSESTRSLLVTARSVTFEAGYNDTRKLLHVGNIVNLFDLRNQPDYSVVVATNDFLSLLSPTIDEGKKTETQLGLIKRVMNQVAPGIIINDNNLQGVTNNATNKIIDFQHKTYAQCMKTFEDEFNINMSISNKVLYSMPKSPNQINPTPDKTIILNYKDSMIGSPQIDVMNSGISVKALINAELLPGNYVTIETINPNIQMGGLNFSNFNQQQVTRGTWQIFSVDHIGDSRGDEWFSNLTGFGVALILQVNNG